MIYRVTLDGSVLDQDNVEGLLDITLEMDRDSKFHGLLTMVTSDLTFLEAAYDTILGEWNSTPCGELTCLIEYQCPNEDYATLFDGILFVNDVEFDLRNCRCTTTIKDNSFQAKIRNNRRIKAHINANKSKNDVTIQPVSPTNVSNFRPSDGTYIYSGRGYRVYDTFRYLVDSRS